MKISALKCLKCNTLIYSRARHDFRWCSCKSCAIDGGFEYCKITGHPENMTWVDIEVDATKEELYQDWNKYADKHGLIKGE